MIWALSVSTSVRSSLQSSADCERKVGKKSIIKILWCSCEMGMLKNNSNIRNLANTPVGHRCWQHSESLHLLNPLDPPFCSALQARGFLPWVSRCLIKEEKPKIMPNNNGSCILKNNIISILLSFLLSTRFLARCLRLYRIYSVLKCSSV